jgi:hypothetical protein
MQREASIERDEMNRANKDSRQIEKVTYPEIA